MSVSPWVGIKWFALGLAALLIGITWSLLAERRLRIWLYSDHYVAAELEVTHFYPKTPDSDARSMIEGVIHPGGERVETTDRDVSLRQFTDYRVEREPEADELAGRRMPVVFWPQRSGRERWWHPPAVLSPGEIPNGGAVARDMSCAVAFVGGALLCFRRGVRLLKQTVPFDAG